LAQLKIVGRPSLVAEIASARVIIGFEGTSIMPDFGAGTNPVSICAGNTPRLERFIAER
jgi:hypothetical protein